MTVFRPLTLVSVLFATAQAGHATQDVESPLEVLAYLRMLLIQPEISQEIVRIGGLGCRWDDQVIWSGSPPAESLESGIAWKTLSMKFTNNSKQAMWVQFAFSLKDQQVVELKNVTERTRAIDCAK